MAEHLAEQLGFLNPRFRWTFGLLCTPACFPCLGRVATLAHLVPLGTPARRGLSTQFRAKYRPAQPRLLATCFCSIGAWRPINPRQHFCSAPGCSLPLPCCGSPGPCPHFGCAVRSPPSAVGGDLPHSPAEGPVTAPAPSLAFATWGIGGQGTCRLLATKPPAEGEAPTTPCRRGALQKGQGPHNPLQGKPGKGPASPAAKRMPNPSGGSQGPPGSAEEPSQKPFRPAHWVPAEGKALR